MEQGNKKQGNGEMRNQEVKTGARLSHLIFNIP